ncbi:DUF4870 domain-containing protein [Loigolactobacillus bifermentans]|uniref:DUF4870 domain-containing protein n=1 Tax=Loigolactobacillus bifermentans TaxID=1607 RepID=UPI00228731A3|nr:DUF4870 domain-containing protein [Loigolactobacillus bifermentans]
MKKVLSALCYLSILFAPFLFPLIVWVICHNNEPEVRAEAARAMLLHIVPLVIVLVSLIIIGGNGIITNNAQITAGVSFLLLGIAGLIDLVLYIYNIYYGIKLLLQH